MLSENYAGQLSTEPLGKAKILVVDDDEATRKVLSLIFTRNRYEVESAVTGQEAIEKAHKECFSIVIMDIILPDMAGVDLIASMKEINPDIVVIIITAYPTFETAVRSMNAGALAYITKPLNMNDVLHTIGIALEKQHFQRMNKELCETALSKLTEYEKIEKTLKHQIELQEFLFSISLDLIGLFPADIGRGITKALERVGKFLDCDRCHVFLFSPDRTSLSNTHEWYADGATFKMSLFRELRVADLPWIMGKIQRLDSIYVPNLADFPSEADKDKKCLQLQDAHSLIIVPLVSNDSLMGFIMLVQSSGIQNQFSEYAVTMAKNIAQIFAHKLANANLERLRIIVGEDEPLFSERIASVTHRGIDLSGIARNTADLIGLVSKRKPHIVIVDFNLPREKTRELIKQLKELVPSINVLLVARDSQDISCLTLAIEFGASGCIPPSVSQEQLMQSIHSVKCGQLAANLGMIQQLFEDSKLSRKTHFASNPLNQRELEILRMASKGMTNKAIAVRLSVSKRTIDSHFRSIFGKLAVTSRIQAINVALKHNWLLSS